MKKHTLLTLFLFLSCSSVFAQESDTLLVNVMAVLRIIDGQVDTVHITQDTLHTHSDENHAGMVVNLESESETLEEIAYLPSQKELDSLRILELDPNDEVDILEIQYLQLKVDSSTHLDNVGAYKNRIDTLARLYKETQKAYKIAKAYFASKEKLDRIVNINYGTRRSIGYSNNKIDLIREQNGRDAKGNIANLSLSDVYDRGTGKFKDLSFIEKLKNDIFSSQLKPNFNVHKLGNLIPNLDEFDIKKNQNAIGFKLELEEDFHLLILDLEKQGRKALLWHQKGWENKIIDAL
jgi:hypothetical protein